jgi:hypothetical protein
MNLEDTLNKKMPKIASAQQPPAAAAGGQPASKTAGAVAAALAAVTKPGEKTAGAASPAGAAGPLFDKLAADLAAQDKTGSLALGNMFGAAIADGFMSQLGMYEKVAESLAAQQGEKIAAAAGTLQGESLLDPEMVALVKEAQENPRAFLARVQKAAEAEDAQLKEAEDKEAAELEQVVQVKAAEHYAHGYEIGKLLVSGG